MPRVPLANLVAGQTLARAVTNAGGMVMMQPGTVLTEALIERLGNMGVESVAVIDEAASVKLTPEEAQRVLDERFAGHEADAWMMELKAIVLKQALKGGDGA